MGQPQSTIASDTQSNGESRTAEDTHPDSMEALIAEATAFGADGDESLDVKAQKALECPCVATLRSGPCGSHFSEAFVCFFKSTAEEKGSDCVHPFVALQNCIKVNPDAFSKDVLEAGDSEKEDEDVQDYKFVAPQWSKEQQSKL
ncbi:mitochondrial intermembrane space import and assembly protein 40 homolog [Aristolochia californica]|uniref:mitochondrial intermembrane space import and assembly protein 40 homolog n=1 Tax=Aristolochia californica TaxID=171875 RepID=UPI0035D7CD80